MQGLSPEPMLALLNLRGPLGGSSLPPPSRQPGSSGACKGYRDVYKLKYCNKKLSSGRLQRSSSSLQMGSFTGHGIVRSEGPTQEHGNTQVHTTQPMASELDSVSPPSSSEPSELLRLASLPGLACHIYYSRHSSCSHCAANVCSLWPCCLGRVGGVSLLPHISYASPALSGNVLVSPNGQICL